MTGRMRLRMGGILALVLVMTGCTQTREISQEEIARDGEYSFSEVHQTLEGKEVEIELTDGRSMPSVALRIVPDSTAWVDLMTDRVRTAQTQELLAIRYKREDRGAVQGALFGAGVGVLVGTAAGALLLDKQKEDALLSEAGFVSRFAAGGIIIGSGVGVGWGMSRGSYDRYVYPHPLDRQMVSAQR